MSTWAGSPHQWLAVIAAIALIVRPSRVRAQNQALADQEDWSATQQEVWEQEQVFWRHLSDGEVDRFMTLWDEQVVDWPSSEGRPVGGSALRSAVEEDASGSDLRYELEPLAINVYGDIGMSFYGVIFRNEKGEATGAGRYIHVWRKRDEEWKIIGGMSAPATDTASWMR